MRILSHHHGRNPFTPSDRRLVALTTRMGYGALIHQETLIRSIMFKSSFLPDTTFALSLPRARLSIVQTGLRNIDYSSPWTARISPLTLKMEPLRYSSLYYFYRIFNIILKISFRLIVQDSFVIFKFCKVFVNNCVIQPLAAMQF